MDTNQYQCGRLGLCEVINKSKSEMSNTEVTVTSVYVVSETEIGTISQWMCDLTPSPRSLRRTEMGT